MDGLECTDDYSKLLDRRDLELVVVATPHSSHCRIVVDALRAGKHVFCEKPLAMNAAECDEMIAAANKAARSLLVYQTHRFNPPFRVLKQFIDENDTGRPLFGVILYLGYEIQRMSDPHSWKGTYEQAGGGVLLDGGAHVVDLANWYFGRPVSVSAHTRIPDTWPEGKGETTGELLITYEDGTIAQVLASFESRLKGGGGLRISAELFYENGNGFGEYAHLGGTKTARVARYVNLEGKETVVEVTNAHGINHAQHVLDCLLGRAEPIATAEDGRMAVAVIEAAYESARTARRVNVPAMPA
jgi:predicted dehydrogenase